MGRPSDADTRLLDVALMLVWQKSFGGVTVEMICAAAGVRPGTFYHFFKSKSELIARALEKHWAERDEEMRRIFDPAKPAVERIGDFCRTCYQRATSQKRADGRVLGSPFMAIGSELGDSDPIIAEVVKRVMMAHKRYMEAAIRDGIADGSFSVCDAAKATRTIAALGLGAMTSARVQNDPLVLRDLGETALHILGYHAKIAAAG